MIQKLLALYGLQFNPFCPDLPSEALFVSPQVDHFLWRMESLVQEGGFALVTGGPGTGKSVVLRLLCHRLSRSSELTLCSLTRPQSSCADFYRELGERFCVSLSPHNRWAGSKLLRERWLHHIQTQLLRPVLIIDEAQEMLPSVLTELRLLGSADLDSRSLLTVVLAGDQRLLDKFGSDDLMPLASRIRLRLLTEPASPSLLADCLRHLLRQAGNPNLLTAPLLDTLCEHALGNYRVLTHLCNELLAVAVQREARQLDEKLYLEVFSHSPSKGRPKSAQKGSPR